MDSPWQSIGGVQAVMREKRVVIQDADGNDIIRLGRDDDDRWALSVYDLDGQLRVRIGQTEADAYGIEVIDATNYGQLYGDHQGLRTPYLSPTTFDPSLTKTVTSSSWTTVWRSHWGVASHLGLGAFIDWSTGSGTPGEMRLTGPGISGHHELAAASSGTKQFAWLHGQPIGSGPLTVDVEARRTGGAGNVSIYTPRMVLQDGRSFTANGVI